MYRSTLLRAGYETGLRRSDLFLLRADAVNDEGVVCVTMCKTGLVHIAQMRHETVLAFRKIQVLLEFHECDYREFPLHWPLSWAELYPILARIRKVAGVSPGALQQLRRSGATACEVDQPGAAMAYLGHTTAAMAAKHYIDRRQLTKAYCPPEVTE
jgi:integrase